MTSETVADGSIEEDTREELGMDGSSVVEGLTSGSGVELGTTGGSVVEGSTDGTTKGVELGVGGSEGVTDGTMM